MSKTMQMDAPQLEELAPAFRPAKRRRTGRRAALAIAVVFAALLTAAIVLHPWTGGTAAPAAPTTQSRVSITGTGPGLQWVAARQAQWARNAVTGTGPGLVYLANFQLHGIQQAVTGTGPGLDRIAQGQGDQVATIGSP
jgi:hypothetical protein